MKKLILILAMFSTNAFAEALPDGTSAIVSVDAELTSTRPLCPPNAVCITDGTIVNLLVTSMGCVDKLLQPQYTVVGDTVVVHLQVAANEFSRRARCIVAPSAPVKLSLNMLFPPFKIQFLGTNQVITVQ